MSVVRPAGPISVTCSSLAYRDALNVVKGVLVEGSPVPGKPCGASWVRMDQGLSAENRQEVDPLFVCGWVGRRPWQYWLRYSHFLQLGSVLVSLTTTKDISLIRDTNASSVDMRP